MRDLYIVNCCRTAIGTFGGALKNIGMGCGSRAGKMEMHSAGKPYINQKRYERRRHKRITD